MARVFALIDANSFYCSCEKAFQPALRDRPVVVLSNNDGCAISRSAEAKALGVEMGDAWHLVHRRPELRDVAWFSSNYTLYGDMSRRIFQVLCAHVPHVEPYSIDEMFLDLTGMPQPIPELCADLREAVDRITKIPTCVGAGPTKVIAKLANRLAKKDPTMNGVCDLTQESVRAALYPHLPVGAVWGIGRAQEARLQSMGANTIADFVRLPARMVRQAMSVTGARLQAELQGVSCLPLSETVPSPKGITVSRSFGRPVDTYSDLREAVCAHMTRAGEKLRAQGLQAETVTVFIMTNPRDTGPLRYSAQLNRTIEPTSSTFELIREATTLLNAMWRGGRSYFKAGIMLGGLSPAGSRNQLLSVRNPRSEVASKVMDALNARFGRGTVIPLSSGIKRTWSPRSSMLSRRYTTSIEEMLTVR